MFTFLIAVLLSGLALLAVIFEVIAAVSGIHLAMIYFAVMALGCGITVMMLNRRCSVFLGVPLAGTCFVFVNIVARIIVS